MTINSVIDISERHTLQYDPTGEYQIDSLSTGLYVLGIVASDGISPPAYREVSLWVDDGMLTTVTIPLEQLFARATVDAGTLVSLGVTGGVSVVYPRNAAEIDGTALTMMMEPIPYDLQVSTDVNLGLCLVGTWPCRIETERGVYYCPITIHSQLTTLDDSLEGGWRPIKIRIAAGSRVDASVRLGVYLCRPLSQSFPVAFPETLFQGIDGSAAFEFIGFAKETYLLRSTLSSDCRVGGVFEGSSRRGTVDLRPGTMTLKEHDNRTADSVLVVDTRYPSVPALELSSSDFQVIGSTAKAALYLIPGEYQVSVRSGATVSCQRIRWSDDPQQNDLIIERGASQRMIAAACGIVMSKRYVPGQLGLLPRNASSIAFAISGGGTRSGVDDSGRLELLLDDVYCVPGDYWLVYQQDDGWAAFKAISIESSETIPLVDYSDLEQKDLWQFLKDSLTN